MKLQHANKLVKLLIISVPTILMFALLWINIDFDGVKIVEYKVGENSPFIEAPLPSDRLSEINKSEHGDFKTIQQDPIYISAHVPRGNYESVTAEVFFENQNQPIIEFGPMADIFSQSFDLRPVDNLRIDNSDWARFEQDGLVLLQRNNEFESISDFFDNLPNRLSIATYNYDFESAFKMDKSFATKVNSRTIPISLRGYHRYVTYLKNGQKFSLNVDITDLNNVVGEDIAEIRLRNEDGQIVVTENSADDANTSDDRINTKRSIHIETNDITEGVYIVELVGTSDIVWGNLTTDHKYMSFLNQIYVVDVPESGQKFYTDGKDIVVETFSADDADSILIGDEKIAIPLIQNKVSSHISESGILSGNILEGSIKMNIDGVFSFEKNAVFNPNPVSLSVLTDLDQRGVDFVLANYNSPKVEANLSISKSDFSLEGIVDQNRDIRFVFSTPKISENESKVDIYKIRLIYRKAPIDFDRIISAIKRRLF